MSYASDQFELLGGEGFKPDTVFHALEIAIHKFEDNAKVCYEADQPRLAREFEHYAYETRRALTILRGDEEDD